MHDIEQPDLFGLTDAEKDRARRRVRKPYPKKKDKPVKSAAPGRTKAASSSTSSTRMGHTSEQNTPEPVAGRIRPFLEHVAPEVIA